MKHSLLPLTVASVLAILLYGGCAIMDALDTYHYIGIYEDSYNDEGLNIRESANKFDEYLTAVTSTTGYSTEIIARQPYWKAARLVIPKDRQSKLDRVVIDENVFGKTVEIGISIIKVPPGEDAEVIELKKNLEKAFELARLRKWQFYIQHTHGQLFNS